MKLIESLLKVLKKPVDVPRGDINKFDSPTTLPANFEDSVEIRSILPKRTTIVYTGISRIYKEQ